MTTRIGPRTRELHEIVSAMPWCTRSPRCEPPTCRIGGGGYLRPIEQAIAAGLIIAVSDKRGKPFKLFATEHDHQLFELREELLHVSPSSVRAGRLVAEIETLRAEQAAAWVDYLVQDSARARWPDAAGPFAFVPSRYGSARVKQTQRG